LLTLPDALSNQVASERKHGYSIRLLSTERVAHAPLGKRLGSRQDNVGGGLERPDRCPALARLSAPSSASGRATIDEVNIGQ